VKGFNLQKSRLKKLLEVGNNIDNIELIDISDNDIIENISLLNALNK